MGLKPANGSQEQASGIDNSRLRLESIFRAAPVGIGLVSERVILEANGFLCKMTGYAREELVGKSARLLYQSTEEFQRVGIEKYRQIEETGVGTIETIWKRRDGALIDVLLSSSILDENHPGLGYTFSAIDITQRKRAERALGEAEARFQRMLAVVPDMISVHNPAMEILYSNWQGFAEVPESMRKTGTKCHSTYRGLDHICPDCQAHSVLDNCEPFHKVAQMPDGRWLDIRVIPLLDENGDVEMFMEWVRDVSEEYRIKEAERSSLALLRIAGETARFGGWSVNLESDACTWSDAVADIHGMPRGFSPTVQEAVKFYAPEWRDTIRRAFRECAEEGIPYDKDIEIINREGRRIWVKTIGRAQRDHSGRIVKVNGSFQDITDRKTAEEELRRETERMAIVLRATRTNINVMDSEYNLTHVDSSWIEFYGDYRGRKCYEYFMGGKSPCPGCGVPRALETGETVVTEEYLIKEDRFVEVHTIPFRDRQGRQMLAEFNIDITERKRSEDERAKLREQLQHARRMESIGRLAGGVAHDFNNMLSVILGNSELILDRIDPSHPLHGEVKEIQQAAARSADLTRQLLTFARRQTITPRLIDLNQTVSGMLQMLRRLIGESIELVWNPGKGSCIVVMDPSQVNQILTNLVANSRDAIKGTGRITIESAIDKLDEGFPARSEGFIPGEYVLLRVIDDGCGIDSEGREHLFEPFYTTKSMGRGTGLGLSTVYGIAQQNRGFVNVISEPGSGTTVTICLPLQVGSLPPDASAASDPRPRGGGQTILLVEDEPSILGMAASMLEQLGYRVIPAETPSQAEALAAEHAAEIDLLLTDVVMPGMNGRRLSERLVSQKPDLRCMFMSGYTADIMSDHSVFAEGVNFIQKPFTLGQLAEAVRKALE